MKKAIIQLSEEQMTIFDGLNIQIFNYQDIIGIFCDQPYIRIVTTTNSKSILIFHSLKEIGQLLTCQFVMCNRSSIINIMYINQVESKEANNFIHLNNGMLIRIPRRIKATILKIIHAQIKDK